MKVTRRDVVKSLGCLAVAPAFLRGAQKTARFPIAFSTLGCPKWEWKNILDRAAEWGYAGIELRGIRQIEPSLEDVFVSLTSEHDGSRNKAAQA